MTRIPTHEMSRLTSCGVSLKWIRPEEPGQLLHYAHRDDYYMFGMVVEGSCVMSVDFREYRLTPGETICVAPGAVHALVRADGLTAVLLIVDALFVNDSFRKSIAEYMLNPGTIPVSDDAQRNFRALVEVLACRLHTAGTPTGREIVHSLAEAAVGIVVEALERVMSSRVASRRAVELVVRLRKLLGEDVPIRHRPAYFAAKMNISPVYLNEVVRSVTGMNVTAYIRTEIMLRARRQLYYTSDSVQQIAAALGFDDSAYFSRLFPRAVGLSPTDFRKKYRG